MSLLHTVFENKKISHSYYCSISDISISTSGQILTLQTGGLLHSAIFCVQHAVVLTDTENEEKFLCKDINFVRPAETLALK